MSFIELKPLLLDHSGTFTYHEE